MKHTSRSRRRRRRRSKPRTWPSSAIVDYNNATTADLGDGAKNSRADLEASDGSPEGRKSMRPSSAASSSSPVPSPRARRPMTTDEMLYAQPASVHFGGFQLERTTRQRVRVYNNSAKAVRLRYTFPMGKKGFKATFASADRPSFVSAGLCEEILVSFTPSAGFQYYYDCIQVQCEEVAYGSSTDVTRSSATIIPLHAYPTVNEVEFPTRMDFGVVPRGTCARKYVDIVCSVPVEFEYELRMTKPHPAFTVFPLTGTIPPRGEARIELEFRPLLYATATAEIELHVSQLGFVPRVCTIAGSSTSTAVNTASAVEVAEPKCSSPKSEENSRRPSKVQEKASRTTTPRQNSKLRGKQNAQVERENGNEDEEEKPEMVGGIEIPQRLNSVTGVNFVLNQEPGKLKPKDLKKAIAANRALRQQQREEQAKLSTGNNTIGDEDSATLSFGILVREEEGNLQRVSVSKQVKDMFFQQELREVEEAEKALEFQSHKVHLGQRLLSREQVCHLTKLRELNSQALDRHQREQLRTMLVTVRYDSPGMSEYHHQDSDTKQPLLLGELKTAVLPAHFTPDYTPDFKTYKNDLWGRRQRVLRRLVRAVSTCILRLRAQKRLNRIRAWLGGAKTRGQVREMVILDWQASAQVTGSDNVHSRRSVDLLKVDQTTAPSDGQCQYYLSSFPMVEESTAQKRRESINLSADWVLKFNSFTFMELKPRDEALLMGHDPLLLPALPTYVPLEQGRMLRQGAAGECGVVASLLPPTTSEINMVSADTDSNILSDASSPSLLEMMPSDLFKRPQASVRPLIEIQGPRETESSYALRPQRVFRTPPSNFSDWLSSQIGLQSIVVSHGDASLNLSDVFVGSADRKQVDPVFPSRTEYVSARKEPPLFGDVWNVAVMTMPPLAERPDDVPSLSDSESDEDIENGAGSSAVNLFASWNHALELFEDTSDDQEDGTERGSSSVCEEGERLGLKRGVFHFERYRHLIRQERAYNFHRHDLLQRLPKLLEDVASQVEHPVYKLVVQGHGSGRPLHHQLKQRTDGKA